jgi:hypothetical protein
MSTNDTTRTALCIEAEALDAVLALPESDPRRAHLRGCPRCHALAESYAMFMAPADSHAAHADDADRAFDALRANLLAGSSASAPSLRRSTWRDWFAPALRPAWALAALTILAGGALLLPRLQSSAPSHVLRGADNAPMTLSPPAAQDGGVKLAWKAYPTADAYTVVFYSPALEELGRVDAGAQPVFVVPAARLPQAYAQGGAVLYRVIASRGGDEIARSSVGTLRRK